MTDRSDYSEISVLIPGCSIDDLPTELAEADAASLLNAVACAWHPALLARSKSVPILRPADSQSGYPGPRILMVSKPCESFLPHEWRSALRSQGHVLLESAPLRSDVLLAIDDFAAIEPAGEASEPAPTARHHPSPQVVDWFLAFGLTVLHVQVLSRRRHHFIDPDTFLLNRELRPAAQAALDGDVTTCRQHLTRAFEHLRDLREKIYPQPCYFIDLCIPATGTSAEQFHALSQSEQPVNLLIPGSELREILLDIEAPDALNAVAAMRSAIAANRLVLLGGQQTESRQSLNSLGTVYEDFLSSQQTLKVLELPPCLHFARRRFGLAASLPGLLLASGFQSALHVALDDGVYPDRECSIFDWQGTDGRTLPAASRIPLPINTAAGFLKLPDRFNDSMQDDPVAVLFLARTAVLDSPWLSDLHHAAEFGPVLGEFITIDRLVSLSEGSRSVQRHEHAEYLSPFLIQASVLKNEQPVSGPAMMRQLYEQSARTQFLSAMTCLVEHSAATRAADAEIGRLHNGVADLEARLAELSSDWNSKQAECEAEYQVLKARLESLTVTLAKGLQKKIPQVGEAVRGLLLINPLPFARTIPVLWPAEYRPPASDAAIVARESKPGTEQLLVKLLPGGFLWLVESQPRSEHPVVTKTRREPPLAEPGLLRNRLFEVTLSERTGGISSVTIHGRRGNRLSQQPCFRYERELKLPTSADGSTPKVAYATCQFVESRVIADGPVFASLESICELSSPVDNTRLAVVRQTFRVDRLSPRLELTLCFDEISRQVRGNPWLTYFGCRFAWENAAADITRSVMGHAAGFRHERFEAPDYIQITDADQQLTILPHGRPYHRKSGSQMIDSLCIVEGESARTFTFTIDFDQSNPSNSALDVARPPAMLMTHDHVPAGGTAGWILGLSARNVELADVRLIDQSFQNSGSTVLRFVLSETLGHSTICELRTARPAVSASGIQPDGTPGTALEISNDRVRVPLGPFQIRIVELTFA
jgi:alpha-mannosidase